MLMHHRTTAKETNAPPSRIIEKALSSGGIKASRDIVQFVELRKFLSGPHSWNKEALAKEVLAEIPDQLVKWMLSRGIKPKCE